MKLLLIAILISDLGFANSISSPAGQLPEARQEATASGVKLGRAKSRLIPIKKKMDVAVSTSKPQANQESLEKAVVPKEPAPSASAEPLKVSFEKVNSDSTESLPSDSLATPEQRFDAEDPAKAVTKGLRVEDIIEPASDYQYVSNRRKNPFIPEIVKGPGSSQRELNPNDVEIPIINPLQSFDLKMLSVIGVWEGSDRVWKALIETPSNQGIEVKIGDPAGNSGGRIMGISTEAVMVREFKVRSDGTREYFDVSLNMGGNKAKDADSLIGGRIILKPGASSSEVEKPTSEISILPPSHPAATGGNSLMLETPLSVPRMENPSSGSFDAGRASALPAVPPPSMPPPISASLGSGAVPGVDPSKNNGPALLAPGISDAEIAAGIEAAKKLMPPPVGGTTSENR